MARRGPEESRAIAAAAPAGTRASAVTVPTRVSVLAVA